MQKLSPEDKIEIKQKWIKNMLQFVKPLSHLDWGDDGRSLPAFHLFVLGK